jgi:hypothetical protein
LSTVVAPTALWRFAMIQGAAARGVFTFVMLNWIPHPFAAAFEPRLEREWILTFVRMTGMLFL